MYAPLKKLQSLVKLLGVVSIQNRMFSMAFEYASASQCKLFILKPVWRLAQGISGWYSHFLTSVADWISLDISRDARARARRCS